MQGGKNDKDISTSKDVGELHFLSTANESNDFHKDYCIFPYNVNYLEMKGNKHMQAHILAGQS